MTRYSVFLTAPASYVIEVEADSKDDAMDKAELAGVPSLCHQCAAIDLGDFQADEENVEVIEP